MLTIRIKKLSCSFVSLYKRGVIINLESSMRKNSNFIMLNHIHLHTLQRSHIGAEIIEKQAHVLQSAISRVSLSHIGKLPGY